MTLSEIEKIFQTLKFPPIEKTDNFKTQAKKILASFGVNEKSEFYEMYSKYFLTAIECRSGSSIVVDVIDGFPVKVAHERWGIPKNYILFSNGEAEGGYLYNTEDDTVWDFNLGQQQALLNGTLPHWNSFYEFMEWYLTIEEED